MRYEAWRSLDEIDISAPQSSGLFQVKNKEGLLTYPTGKTAMFYYGYANNLNFGLRLFKQNVLPVLDVQETLLARWMEAVDFESRFRRQLEQFASKFGSLPFGNDIYLKSQSQKT